jgi:hypothetical protein
VRTGRWAGGGWDGERKSEESRGGRKTDEEHRSEVGARAREQQPREDIRILL